jgi:hypothetical protein
LPDIATALVPIAATAWKTAQHFSYGARGFMRVPVSEANDLNYWLGAFAPIGEYVRKAWESVLTEVLCARDLDFITGRQRNTGHKKIIGFCI